MECYKTRVPDAVLKAMDLLVQALDEVTGNKDKKAEAIIRASIKDLARSIDLLSEPDSNADREALRRAYVESFEAMKNAAQMRPKTS